MGRGDGAGGCGQVGVKNNNIETPLLDCLGAGCDKMTERIRLTCLQDCVWGLALGIVISASVLYFFFSFLLDSTSVKVSRHCTYPVIGSIALSRISMSESIHHNM